MGRGGGAPNSLNSSLDILRPAGTDQPLIYWLLDDPAVYARYTAILRELGTKAFAEPELMRLVDALEAAGAGQAGNSPRDFLRMRAAYMQQVLAQLK
jgi:hypothetical protein